MRIILCGFGAVGQSLASLFESRAKELYEMAVFTAPHCSHDVTHARL